MAATRAAVADMRPKSGAAWRIRYGVEAGAELQIRALLERVEAEMRAAGEETTIRTVWPELKRQR